MMTVSIEAPPRERPPIQRANYRRYAMMTLDADHAALDACRDSAEIHTRRRWLKDATPHDIVWPSVVTRWDGNAFVVLGEVAHG